MSRANGNRAQCSWVLLPQFFAAILAFAAACSVRENARAQDHLAGITLPRSSGWESLPNTEMAPLCPGESPIRGNSGCSSVIDAWNSGVADTKRDQLILWGGGHSDYFGNEVYALDLKSSSMQRLTDPSPVSNVGDCPEAYTDGSPSARHTYGGLVYDPNLDAMFTFGGSKASCGAMSRAIWKFELETHRWTMMRPEKGELPAAQPGIIADFDPNTGMIFLSDRQDFFRYDPKANKLTKLKAIPDLGYSVTGLIDPRRKLFLMIGWPGQLWTIGIGGSSGYAVRNLSQRAKGCEKLLQSHAPGLAFDPVRGVVVAWAGGSSVILLDSEKVRCSEVAFPDGPGAAQASGTRGHFRYFPSRGVFALVNDWKQDAFLLRLNSAEAPVH